ncbi:MAG: hypothetical protein DRQ39_06695 [Gammaproteobacteria bacterium]|nr:MAG: hypothetical protein DRQ39_06695 [Gammaproteobacteria bacterium]RKZ95505.1 MAG: hypothetical protein DRQ40_03445 [Gammaproteobacteria bacterium]
MRKLTDPESVTLSWEAYQSLQQSVRISRADLRETVDVSISLVQFLERLSRNKKLPKEVLAETTNLLKSVRTPTR